MHIKLKDLLILMVLLISFASGVYVKSIFTPCIAVVNLEKVLEQSPQLSAFKKDNEEELKKLSLWIDDVNKEIDAEKDETKHLKLANQYKRLTMEKERLIKQEYNIKLKKLNAEITSLIEKVAKQFNCNAVFTHTSMVIGGKDITEDVIKALK